MLPWQRAAKARAGMDRDESTTMDCDIAIYQTVYADADSDGPGSDRGRAHGSAHLLHQLSRRFSDQTATMRAARDGSRTVAPLVDGYLYHIA